ncbi:MAG TPA: hypothetical protein VFA67_14865 [Candidatus Sulfotelmatobacter sp.]|nr:hypothetical protein [Candidatus Sulfotelmatobacter sp.]
MRYAVKTDNPVKSNHFTGFEPAVENADHYGEGEVAAAEFLSYK